MTNKKFKLAAMSLATAVAVSAVGPSASAVTYYLGDGSVTVDKDDTRGAYSYQGEDGSEEHRTYVNEDKAETGDGTIYVKDGNAPTGEVPPSTDTSNNGTEETTPTDNTTDSSGNNTENSSTSETAPGNTITVEESKGVLIGQAGMNTIIGIGTVFVMLIFLIFVISSFDYILGDKKKKKAPAAPVQEAPKAVAAPVVEDVCCAELDGVDALLSSESEVPSTTSSAIYFI